MSSGCDSIEAAEEEQIEEGLPIHLGEFNTRIGEEITLPFITLRTISAQLLDMYPFLWFGSLYEMGTGGVANFAYVDRSRNTGLTHIGETRYESLDVLQGFDDSFGLIVRVDDIQDSLVTANFWEYVPVVHQADTSALKSYTLHVGDILEFPSGRLEVKSLFIRETACLCFWPNEGTAGSICPVKESFINAPVERIPDLQFVSIAVNDFTIDLEVRER